MRNILDTVVDKIKSLSVLNNSAENFCSLLDGVKKSGRAKQATNDCITRRMRVACCITEAADTHSEFVVLIALSEQQSMSERASMLRYTCIVSVVFDGTIRTS
jgi:ribonucleotide reductase beta subunit family protein with ferritin-like domain